MRPVWTWLIVPILVAVATAAHAQNLANITTLFYSEGHGTQVEYLHADGKSYLWYPGNRIVLTAPWKKQGDRICYLYRTNTYNPVTGSRGGQWECTALLIQQARVLERVKGDVFALAEAARNQTVPFVLSRNKTTIARLSGGKAIGTPVPPPEVPDIGIRIPRQDLSSRVDVNRLLTDCGYALRHAEADSLTMQVVGGFYFWGGRRQYERKCTEVDYARAFRLFRKSGDAQLFAQMTAILRQHARRGEAAAIEALNTVDLTPLR